MYQELVKSRNRVVCKSCNTVCVLRENVSPGFGENNRKEILKGNTFKTFNYQNLVWKKLSQGF